jgi:ADP-ribosylglycohydrolase
MLTKISGVMDKLPRVKGSLLGLAICDALGAPVEFCAPGSFAPVTGYTSGGVFGLPAGSWTDDTSLALCLADSLISCNGFDAVDQMKRYVRWWREGYLSINGHCFDIGNTTRSALSKFESTEDPYCGPTDVRTAGNGSLMRLAPIPLFYANRPIEAIKYAALSSRTTHAALESMDACRYYASLIVGAINGVSKEKLLSNRYELVPGMWKREPLTPKIDEIASGSFKKLNPPEIMGSGYVVKSMEAALWAFYHSSTFKEGALLAVNLGDDADTTGAIYGQLAGAYYGENAIPKEWRTKLVKQDLIIDFATKIYNISKLIS